MKILFLTNIPSPYRVDFFNELGKYCELTVAFEGESATDRDKKWKAAEFQNFKAIFLKGIRTKSDQFLCFDIIKVIKGGFDRIIVGGYSTPTGILAIEYMKIHRILFWIEADGGMISQDSRIKFWIKKHFISTASGWFSSGRVTTEYLEYYGAAKEKIHLYSFSSLLKADILETVPSAEVKEKARKKLGMSEDGIVISVGQFIPRKGFDVLLNAWKKIPDSYGLYIIGAEPTEEYLKLQKSLALKNIHFVGFKNKRELKEYYIAADLFAFPTREDIWGLVINEAMANGLPVITTNKCVAGLELVEDSVNGYIVPVEDGKALAEKIIYVLDNDDIRRKMEKNSLNKIKKWTIENMAKQHWDALT